MGWQLNYIIIAFCIPGCGCDGLSGRSLRCASTFAMVRLWSPTASVCSQECGVTCIELPAFRSVKSYWYWVIVIGFRSLRQGHWFTTDGFLILLHDLRTVTTFYCFIAGVVLFFTVLVLVIFTAEYLIAKSYSLGALSLSYGHQVTSIKLLSVGNYASHKSDGPYSVIHQANFANRRIIRVHVSIVISPIVSNLLMLAKCYSREPH